MEQKRPADIFQELLDYLWSGLGLEEKDWKRLKKGDFKKKMKNGLTYQICFDRSRYNYIDYEIGHGNVEMGFTCIIKQGDDYLYSFKIEPCLLYTSIPTLKQIFPVKDPTNGEVQEEFDLCFDKWIGKEDWERWMLLVRDSLPDMTAEESDFLRSLLEWAEMALTKTSVMVVESNL